MSLEDSGLATRGDALEAKGWVPIPVYLRRDSTIVLCRDWEDPVQPGSRLRTDQAEEVQRARDAEVFEVMGS